MTADFQPGDEVAVSSEIFRDELGGNLLVEFAHRWLDVDSLQAHGAIAPWRSAAWIEVAEAVIAAAKAHCPPDYRTGPIIPLREALTALRTIEANAK